MYFIIVTILYIRNIPKNKLSGGTTMKKWMTPELVEMGIKETKEIKEALNRNANGMDGNVDTNNFSDATGKEPKS
jgi:hypothetical protein